MSRFEDEPTPQPYVPPPAQEPAKEVKDLAWSAPFGWLRAGLADFRTCPALGLFYGFAFWLMAMVLGLVFQNKPAYTMTMASGCLLVGPFFAMGLYEASRRRELKKAINLASSLVCWRGHLRSMGLLLGLLMVLELLWGRLAMVVIAVFFDTGMPSSEDALQVVLNPENIDFVLAYATVGAAFSALVFSISVVSIPMILDRDTDAISAAIASIEVVVSNTGVMLLWGGMIAVLIGLSLWLPWGLGLLIVGPVLGHASWHAYRGSVRWLT